MSSKLERIYAVMPIGIQNFMATAQGLKLRRIRYGGNYRKHLDDLMRSQWFSKKQFQDLQLSELKKLIRDAVQHTGYYSRSLRNISDNVETMTLEHLKDIPFVDKNFFRRNVDEFVNRERLKLGRGESHSTGTTGTPLLLPWDYNCSRFNAAFRTRQYRWAGLTGREPSARFSGRLIMGRYDNAPYWRRNSFEKQWLFSVFHINRDTASLYYEALKKFNCAYLDGYPTVFFELAKWINGQGKSGQWRPWAVITTSETLLDFHRKEIEAAFGCPVYNYYSSGEGAPWITTCETGHMHVNPEAGIVEFLGPDGECAAPGEEAEMVVTSFTQKTTPLIRYRIGDTGVLSKNQHCPCGREMPVVDYVGGRETDYVHSTETGAFSSAAMSTVLYAIPTRISTSQVEQVGTDSFVFRYVPEGPDLTEREQAIVVKEFRDRLGRSIRVKIDRVDQIPKGPGGKSRLVIGLSTGKNLSTESSDEKTN